MPIGERPDGRTRRQFLAGVAAGAAVAPILRSRPARAASEPVKIGVLNTYTSGKYGIDNFAGMSLYLDEIGWQAGGRKIELVKEDDQFNPQIGLQKLRKLVENDKVALVTGVQASSVAMALLNYIKQTGIFFLCSGAGTDAITWDRIPYLFRSSVSTSMAIKPIAAWIADNIAKEAALVASDYAGGHDVLRVFSTAFKAKGGKILREIYPPLNTGEYSPYITELRAVGAPVNFDFFPGTDAVRFVRLYSEMGLKAKSKIAGFGIFEADNLPAMGDAALGGISTQMWSEVLDNPENRKFVAAYQAKVGEVPSFYSEYGYVGARVIAETLNATGGDTAPDKLAKAMVEVKFAAPRGPFRFDPVTHNVIENIYIKQVVQGDGRLTDKILATYPDQRDPGERE